MYQMLISIARQQAEAGVEVVVIASRRADTPELDRILTDLGEKVTYLEVSGVGLGSQLRQLVQAARRQLVRRPETVLHLHSSWAGAALRLALGWGRTRQRIVYSPHGFSFLREDLSRTRRLLFTAAETVLARRCSGLLLASESETSLARNTLHIKRVAIVENTVDLGTLPARVSRLSEVGPRVVTAGRVTYQKAPWRFSALADALHESARFEWLGDGSKSAKDAWLSSESAAQVSGWLAHAELLRRVAAADVFVMTSLWEGMPVALIEAQCLGLPAVVTNCVGNRDVVIHGVTGYVVDSDEELVLRVRQLIADPDQAEAMGTAALAQRARFSEERLAEGVESAYRRLGALPRVEVPGAMER
ncbi:hypothetical protein BIU98_14900 [Curtobacterium sp. MMLR14_010]|uniref:glycosyltransferase n=1 Tax=Curtobacterium sp. MMLR14_010 TaxID=1898743 RepID=UPI0008DE0C35|nr:glycosyltransferase [Curtobacterium sp. MMLR14_010]OII38160.1 hypothetical protein BIU98_14900 [Curtobacterium sp. MMLR14_010]